MVNATTLLGLIAAYLVGSLSPSVWLGKVFRGVDVRDHGSGNAGFTNVLRVLGPGLGIPVLLLDIAKGMVAVKLATWLPLGLATEELIMLWMIFYGLAAILGHLFPLFTGFRGGKGVATGLGVVLIIFPYGALLSLGIFLVVFTISRYVSLGSILAGVSFPLFVLFMFHKKSIPLAIFAWTIAALVVFTHRKNIDRILKGTERRARIFMRRRKKRTQSPARV